MSSILDSLLDELEDIDNQLARHVREVENGQMEISALRPGLRQRRQVIAKLSKTLPQCSPAPFTAYNRLVVSQKRGAQLLSACHQIRGKLNDKLAESRSRRTYASRLASLLAACETSRR